MTEEKNEREKEKQLIISVQKFIDEKHPPANKISMWIDSVEHSIFYCEECKMYHGVLHFNTEFDVSCSIQFHNVEQAMLAKDIIITQLDDIGEELTDKLKEAEKEKKTKKKAKDVNYIV